MTISLLSILRLASNTANKVRNVKVQISFVTDGITIKIMQKKLTRKSHVCRNTYFKERKFRGMKISEFCGGGLKYWKLKYHKIKFLNQNAKLKSHEVQNCSKDLKSCKNFMSRKFIALNYRNIFGVRVARDF